MQITPQQEEAGIIHSYKIKLFWPISPINYSENKTHKRGKNGHELLQLDAHFKAPPTWLWEINTKQWILPFFYVFRFTNIATAVTNMGNKDLDKSSWG